MTATEKLIIAIKQYRSENAAEDCAPNIAILPPEIAEDLRALYVGHELGVYGGIRLVEGEVAEIIVAHARL